MPEFFEFFDFFHPAPEEQNIVLVKPLRYVRLNN